MNNKTKLIFILSILLFCITNTSIANEIDRDNIMQSARKAAHSRKFQKSVSLYNHILSFYPKDLEAILGKARAYAWSQNYSQAIANYKLALKIRPLLVEAEMGILRIFSWQGKTKLAIKGAKTLYRRNHKNIEINLFLARLFSFEKEYDLSIKLYKETLSLYPSSIEAQIGIARVLAWQGNKAEALKQINIIYQNHPENRSILLLRGWLLGITGQLDESIENYQPLLDKNPNDLEALGGIAKIYKWQNKTNMSMPLYKQILELDPSNIDVLINMGILYSRVGNGEKAITTLQKAKKLAPKRVDVRIWLGTLLNWQAKKEAAITELKQAIALDDNDLSSYLSLGKVYRQQQSVKEAINIYLNVLKRNPENIEALASLGDIYLGEGNWSLAESYYKKALSIKKDDPFSTKGLKRLTQLKKPHVGYRYKTWQSKSYDLEQSKDLTNSIETGQVFEYKQNLSGITQLYLEHFTPLQTRSYLVDNSTDYQVAGFISGLGIRQNISDTLLLRSQINYHSFVNQGTHTYNMNGTDRELSGFLILSKEFDNQYLTASYGREAYLNARTGQVSIAYLNRSSIDYDININKDFSLYNSVAQTYYSTSTNTRHTALIRERLWLPVPIKLQIQHQYEYWLNPKESFNTFFLTHLGELYDNLRYRLEYLLSFGNIEKKELNILLSFNINDNFDLMAIGVLSDQNYKNDDLKVNFSYYQLALNLRI
jgi:tetratricopeptide (TPR) repeat protein